MRRGNGVLVCLVIGAVMVVSIFTGIVAAESVATGHSPGACNEEGQLFETDRADGLFYRCEGGRWVERIPDSGGWVYIDASPCEEPQPCPECEECFPRWAIVLMGVIAAVIGLVAGVVSVYLTFTGMQL